MYKISIKLAGINISLEYRYPETRYFFSNFETKEEGKYVVSIVEERFIEEKNTLFQKFPWKRISQHEIEYNALYRDIIPILLEEDIMMFHGVLLSMNGDGYVFTAPSGTGKSTHALLWTETFSDKACIINGDKPLLKLTEEGIVAYGSPWTGKEKIGKNEYVILKNICHIQRNDTNSIEKVTWCSNTLIWLLNATHFVGREATLPRRISWLKRAQKHLSFYELKCNINKDAAHIAYNGMNHH